MKKIISILLVLITLSSSVLVVFAKNDNKNEAEIAVSSNFTVNANAAYLIEANTGTVLFEQNPDESASVASVTKTMTLLLVMEALRDEKIKLDDSVMISANAASMGGSQVFLEEGEEMSVEELIKCTVIASANDAALALAEHVSGSEESFVSQMNIRAKQMGLKNTAFENVTGLDDTTQYHYSSAKDIAEISKELVKYPMITKYASLWQDTIRNGEFTLTNTNRLVRYYDGCNGLKTGSTDKAGYCVSASAERDGMQLIAVVLGAESRDVRNAVAKQLLDYGFANYALYKSEEKALEEIDILGGGVAKTSLYQAPFSALISKGDVSKVELIYQIPENLTAPITENQICGKVTYKIGDTVIGEGVLTVKENIERMSFFDIFSLIVQKIFFA